MSKGMSTLNKVKGFVLGIGCALTGVFFLYASAGFREAAAGFEYFDELGIALVILGLIFVLMPFFARMRSLAGFLVNTVFAVLSYIAITHGELTGWQFLASIAFGLLTGSFALSAFSQSFPEMILTTTDQRSCELQENPDGP